MHLHHSILGNNLMFIRAEQEEKKKKTSSSDMHLPYRRQLL
jgi:hypothetical protein